MRRSAAVIAGIEELEMVTLAGYPPASLIWDTPSLRDEADRTRDALRDLCAPLGEISGRRSLESYLATVESTYERLLRRLMEVALENQSELLDLFREAEASRARIEALVDSHRRMLGEETAEQLSAAIASFYGFSRWAGRSLERVLKGDSKAIIEAPPFTMEQGRHALWAGLCFLAIRLVLENDIKAWRPASLRTLIAAFDDYIESVEDAFLGARPLRDLTDTVPESALSDVLEIPD